MATASINITPSWVSSARILLEVVKHGDSAEAKRMAEAEIMEMAKKLDGAIDRMKRMTESHNHQMAVYREQLKELKA